LSEESGSGLGSIGEEFLDCTGRKRTFRLRLYAGDQFLEAVEMRPDETAGWRFALPVKFGEDAPFGEMRDRVREQRSEHENP